MLPAQAFWAESAGIRHSHSATRDREYSHSFPVDKELMLGGL